MSAFGTKRTSLVALHMCAFGGRADIALVRCTCLLLTQSDIRRPPRMPLQAGKLSRYDERGLSRGGRNETARVHRLTWWCGGKLAGHDVCATARRSSGA